jgi:sugar porter (SP) family MFS transporter
MDHKINKLYVILLSVIVALGGFLLGFDSAVISGAVPFYREFFNLDQGSFWFGFSVASLTVGSIAGNLMGGILSDKYGRKIILMLTATLFAFCALGTAMAQSFVFFIIARIIGGIGVGMAILVAPMYIAEVAPKKYRGTLVSINQLNIVIGISIAFFSNYIIQDIVTDPERNWRWMLGVGALPAVLYFLLLYIVPQSPRWLVQHGRADEAGKVLMRIGGDEYSQVVLNEISESVKKDEGKKRTYFRDIFKKQLKYVLLIGFGIAALQQISAINAILYYSTIIFETAGGGRDAAFVQAVILGVTNLVFTIVAMFLIDRLGRKPLLIIGLTGIITAYLVSSLSFYNATYKITPDSMDSIVKELSEQGTDKEKIMAVESGLNTLIDKEYSGEVAFFNAVEEQIGTENYTDYKDTILEHSIDMNAILLLAGILLFMASFAISLGPVTWALLSEIFPNKIRGLAISLSGFLNALVSSLMITVFPISLEIMGSGSTYIILCALCSVGLIFVLRYIPETKGKSLEELEKQLIR